MHFPDTSVRLFYEPLEVGSTKQKATRPSAVIRELVGGAAGSVMCVRTLIPELKRYMCVNQQPVCVYSILHPAPIPQGPCVVLLCWRLIRGRLVRDTRAIVLTLTVGH